MGKISLDLARIKSAGIYTLEYDNTETTTIDSDSLRLLVGFSPKGPFNKPVLLNNEADRKKILGDIDTKMEHKGCYFNRFAQTMLTQGSILTLNLLNVDDSQNGPDQVNFAAMSLAASKANPQVASGKYGEYNYMYESDSKLYGTLDSSYIPCVGATPYSSLFDRTKFWNISDENLTAVVANKLDKDQDNTGIYDKSNFLNFANVGTDEFSILVLKAESLTGYDITAKEWYGSEDNIPFGWVRPADFISDYFIQVIAIKGNWSNYPVLASDPTWSAYFNKNGIKKDMIAQFVRADGIELLGSWTGSIIPDFENKQGTNMFIIDRINANTEVTGLLAAFNKDAAQVLSYDYNGIDNDDDNSATAGSWIYDYDYDHQGLTADGETTVNSVNGYLIDMVGHDLQKGYSIENDSSSNLDIQATHDKTSSDGTTKKFTLLKSDYTDPYIYIMFTTTDATTTNYITKDSIQGIGTTVSTENTFTTVFPTKSTSDATEKVGTLGAELYGIYKKSVSDIEPIDPETYFQDAHHQSIFRYNTLYRVNLTNYGKASYPATNGNPEEYLGVYGYSDSTSYPAIVELYHLTVNTSDTTKNSFRKVSGSPVETDGIGKFIVDSSAFILDVSANKFYKLKNSTTDQHVVSFLSYEYSTQDINDITDIFTDTYYFYDSSMFVGNTPVSLSSKNIFMCFDDNCKGDSNKSTYNSSTESRGIKVGDLVKNIAFEDETQSNVYHVIPGLTKIISKVFVSVDELNGQFTYKGNVYTLNLDNVNLIDDGRGVKGFYLFVATEAVLINAKDHTITSQYPLSDEIISGTLRFIPMKGLKITKAMKPGYDASGNISSEGGVEKIYSLLASEGIHRGLCNPDMINFRYIVDSMGFGLDSELGGKKYVSAIAKDRGKCTAILNAPSMRQFAISSDPYFCDTYVSGTEVRPPFNSKYIPSGGNDELYATKIFSLPTEENGAKFAACFWPWLEYTINGKKLIVPPAADVVNVLIRKYQGNNPYMIAANLNGILNNTYLTGIEYKADNTDRDYLEPFGINTIISRNGNIMIYGNQTCFQKVKSDFNKLHVREDLNMIEIECENILHNYNFEYNTATLRASIKTALTPVLQAPQTSGAIDTFEITCDETNNTEDIINQNYGIVDIAIEFNHGMEKIVNRITVNKYGSVVS